MACVVALAPSEGRAWGTAEGCALGYEGTYERQFSEAHVGRIEPPWKREPSTMTLGGAFREQGSGAGRGVFFMTTAAAVGSVQEADAGFMSSR